MTYAIAAASVNHNTSSYMELMLRSLFMHHSNDFALSLTVFDNTSTDDMTGLISYASRKNISVVPSGLPITTHNNSHGDVLRSFAQQHPACTHYLFLDADVCFIEPHTIQTMLEELEGTPDAFAIGPRMSWDGITEIPLSVRQANPDICDARLHPCCALVRNTPVFRSVVDLVGLSCVRYLWATHDEYLDTFKLMTRVMQTHGLTHTFSSAMIQHFFSVSYDWDTEEIIRHKAQMRHQRLAALRTQEQQEGTYRAA